MSRIDRIQMSRIDRIQVSRIDRIQVSRKTREIAFPDSSRAAAKFISPARSAGYLQQKNRAPSGATPSICLVEAIIGKITTLQRKTENCRHVERQLAKS